MMTFVRISQHITVHYPEWGCRGEVRTAHKGHVCRTPHTESESDPQTRLYSCRPSTNTVYWYNALTVKQQYAFASNTLLS